MKIGFSIGSSDKSAINLVPPVLSGTVASGNSPIITPGVWSKNETERLYTLKADGQIVYGLDKVSRSAIESYVYKVSDLNKSLILEEQAKIGGGTIQSNTAIGYLFSSVARFTTSNYYQITGSAPNIPSGSTSMTMAVVWRKITPTTTPFANQTLFQRYSTIDGGFRMNLCDANGSTGYVRQIVYARDSAPSTIFIGAAQSQAITPTQNLIQRSLLVLNGDILHSYLNGFLHQSVLCTGYTTPSSIVHFNFTGLAGTADELELISVSISDTHAMNPAAIENYDDQVKSFGSRIIPNATHHWEASDAGDVWVDQIQGIPLTKTGSPVVRTFEPTFE